MAQQWQDRCTGCPVLVPAGYIACNACLARLPENIKRPWSRACYARDIVARRTAEKEIRIWFLANELAAPPIPSEPMARINSRAKGQVGEREIIDLLQPVLNEVFQEFNLPPPFLQRNQLQSHKGGQDLHGFEWFSFEVKRTEKEDLPNHWAQCVRQAKENQIPVLLHRRNRRPWFVRFVADVDTPGAGVMVEMVIDTPLDCWLDWFRATVREMLANGERLP